ncbi:unnamed protein product [Hymenolepis diminuta]|uniref:Nucleolar GTP-binding protein 1 n=1 Tax=Hymenolepis diminuta TaxID=6216 RepID=A0A0R3SG65_HYMDI|nr:unnamed protein product [Hymenolepis diminuta]VUZ55144.1 unnamed protein product [Hymenolepis diminuta]
MSGYNFKSITVVPPYKEFIDIVLSKTQRTTPTVIHKQYPMPRIRAFYMRKVKTCQQYFHDKLNTILTEFPMLDNIHPFYADLISLLYSRDHYKLALGEINKAKTLIDGIGRDQVKLIKYGAALYQCKTLKRTAFGRMCTIIKRNQNNLKYLEEIRQHMSRLPCIIPDTRTLVICGFPNVGKSSFINKITRADVDVQPFPFTTKMLFVGHTDYKNLRWQVIDTPGVLDRDLDQCNTIEMTAITALSHLPASVIYIMDPSEHCGFSIEEQVHLFKTLEPLMSNKPVLVVANKTDVINLDSLPTEKRELILSICRLPGDEDANQDKPIFLEMSTLLGDGVMDVRARACDELLARRVEAKLRAGAASLKEGSIANRLYIAQPKNIVADRPPQIPDSVIRKRGIKRTAAEADLPTPMNTDSSDALPVKKRMTLREKELAEGDDFYLNLRDEWLLRNPQERNDIIPEIVDGHNIFDYFDPDIEAKLNQLEEQEKQLEAAGVYDEQEDPDLRDPRMQELRITAGKIREARALRILESQSRKNKSKSRISRTEHGVSGKQMEEELGKLGLSIDPNDMVDRSRSRKAAASRRRDASASLARSKSLHEAAVARSSRPRARSGVRDAAMEAKAIRRAKTDAARLIGAKARKGEGDHHIPDLKPKHLFSGKRPIGKTQRR